MKVIIHINPKAGSAYIPAALRKEGFSNAVVAYATNTLLVLVKPTTTKQDTQQALRLLAKELELEN